MCINIDPWKSLRHSCDTLFQILYCKYCHFVLFLKSNDVEVSRLKELLAEKNSTILKLNSSLDFAQVHTQQCVIFKGGK